MGGLPDRAGVSSEAPPVVLITGAAGGLGSALTSAFADAGWQVVAGWHVNSPTTNRPEVTSLQLDVTDTTSVEAAFDLLEAKFRRLDLLINNAGIARDSLVAQMSLADWDAVMEVNLAGAFRCARAALRRMIPVRSGHILNIASFGGLVGRAGQTNYAASKAGLLGLTQALAREAGEHNVQVNAILPGFLRTGLVGNLSEQQLAGHAASNALGRLNDCGEVARFAVALATMRNVSGQIFQLDSRIAPWG